MVPYSPSEFDLMVPVGIITMHQKCIQMPPDALLKENRHGFATYAENVVPNKADVRKMIAVNGIALKIVKKSYK